MDSKDPVPSPSCWPKWSPLALQDAWRQTIGYIPSRWRRLPLTQVPEGWSNDFEKHCYAWRCHENYGGIRWWFNEVLHIPGNPTVLLFSKSLVERLGGHGELVEVDGCFFLHRTGEVYMERCTVMIEGNPSLDMVLSGLRGEGRLTYGNRWPMDMQAAANYDLWKDRAYAERQHILGSDYDY